MRNPAILLISAIVLLALCVANSLVISSVNGEAYDGVEAAVRAVENDDMLSAIGIFNKAKKEWTEGSKYLRMTVHHYLIGRSEESFEVASVYLEKGMDGEFVAEAKRLLSLLGNIKSGDSATLENIM